MRNLLLMTLLTLLLAGATHADEDAQCATMEGRIQPAGPSIYMEGSHELHDAQGEVLARLSGLEHEVDLEKSEGQWVKVCGQWRPTVEGGGQILEVCTVAPSESVPPQP